jgi:hypothetical protein
MLVDVISMIASVGSSIIGSGTLSTLTSRFPCQVTAFICIASKCAAEPRRPRVRPPMPGPEKREVSDLIVVPRWIPPKRICACSLWTLTRIPRGRGPFGQQEASR